MSLAAMREEVEDLEIAVDGDEIREAYAVRDRLDARIAVAVARFEADDLHTVDGAVTMQSWLRQHAGRDFTSAQRACTVGRKLRSLPVLAAAVLDGSVTGGQLDIILAHVPRRHLELFAAHEPDIVPLLVGVDVDVTRRAMERWRQRADALDPGPAPTERDNEVHLSRTINDRAELRGSFDADLAALVDAGLRVADSHELDKAPALRRAEALAQVFQTFLDLQHANPGGRHRPHVNVVIGIDDLETGVGARYVDTDAPVAPDAFAVLRCDATFHRVLVSSTGTILDYGRAARFWPANLYAAIVLRDGGCRIPGCQAPPSWCDVHHVREWDHGGSTSLDNGMLACRRHHGLVHSRGWSVKLLPDGTVELTSPLGRVTTSDPRGPRPRELFPDQRGGS